MHFERIAFMEHLAFRSDLVRETRTLPEIRAIAEADVWDERGEDRPENREEPVSA